MLESKAAFARRKGWNRSTATRYAEAGKIVVTAEGLVDVEASEQLLASVKDPLKEGVRQRHQRERQRRGGGHGHGSDRGQGEAGTRVDPNDTTYQLLTKHRAAAEYNRAELLRLELEEKEGRLVDADVARKRTFQLARSGRDAVMNLRYRIDPLLAGETDPAKRAEIWDRETRLICEEIARAAAAPFEAAGGSGD